MTFKEWFATSMVASWLRVFVAVIIAMFIADGADIFAVDVNDLRAWLAAAFASALPLVLRFVNPDDTQFGYGSAADDRFDVFEDDE